MHPAGALVLSGRGAAKTVTADRPAAVFGAGAGALAAQTGTIAAAGGAVGLAVRSRLARSAADSVAAGLDAAIQLAVAGRLAGKPATQSVAAGAGAAVVGAGALVLAALQTAVAVAALGPRAVFGAVADVFARVAGIVAAGVTGAGLAVAVVAFLDETQRAAAVAVCGVLVVALLHVGVDAAVSALGRLGEADYGLYQLAGLDGDFAGAACGKGIAAQAVDAQEHGFFVHLVGEQDHHALGLRSQGAGLVGELAGLEGRLAVYEAREPEPIELQGGPVLDRQVDAGQALLDNRVLAAGPGRQRGGQHRDRNTAPK